MQEAAASPRSPSQPRVALVLGYRRDDRGSVLHRAQGRPTGPDRSRGHADRNRRGHDRQLLPACVAVLSARARRPLDALSFAAMRIVWVIVAIAACSTPATTPTKPKWVEDTHVQSPPLADPEPPAFRLPGDVRPVRVALDLAIVPAETTTAGKVK